MNPDIRLYRESDQRAVVELWGEALPDSSPHNEPAAIIRAKVAHSRELFLVAEAVAGTILGGYDGHRGWLYSVAVAEPYRRKGVGSALVRRMEVLLADLGCAKANLQVRACNAEVVAFYGRLGYCVEERVSMGKRLY